jgi:hypothetical protein
MKPKKKLPLRYQAATRRGNLKPLPSRFDRRFPRTGLIARFAPKIKAFVSDFCLRWPDLDYDGALTEAIILAHIAEQTFDPTKGSFATWLEHHLRGLNRWAALELTGRSFKTWSEPGAPTRLTLARKGSEIAISVRPLARIEHWSELGRVTIKRGYTRAVMRRATPDIKTIVGAKPAFLRAALRVAIEHNERRQREENAEAENRKAGNFDTVRLDTKAADIEVDETLPPRIDLEHGTSKPEQLLAEAVKIVRPTLKPNEVAVLDWRLGQLSGTDERRLIDVAAALGIKNKGTISKIRKRIDAKLKQHARISDRPTRGYM